MLTATENLAYKTCFLNIIRSLGYTICLDSSYKKGCQVYKLEGTTKVVELHDTYFVRTNGEAVSYKERVIDFHGEEI